jgi:hypothetical protein
MNNAPPIKAYILNFWTDGVNIGSLQQYLHDSVDVIAYWNYIPLVYCIKSRLNALELKLKLASFFPNGGFMIAEINIWNMDGSLVGPAWDWFYLDHHDKIRPPAPVAGLGLGLGSILGGGFDPLGPPSGFLPPPFKKK